VELLIIRPDAWNFPLLIHVGGAMVLVGTLVVTALTLTLSARKAAGDERVPLLLFACRMILFGVIPSYIVMRGGAQWILSKEHLDDSNAQWIGIGFGTSDGGALLIVISAILAGIASRKLRRDPAASPLLTQITAVIAYVLIAAFVVAIWAMTTKPI
jgi:hypothetical protein